MEDGGRSGMNGRWGTGTMRMEVCEVVKKDVSEGKREWSKWEVKCGDE